MAVAFTEMHTSHAQELLIFEGDGSELARPGVVHTHQAVTIMRETAERAFKSGRQVIYLCDGPPDEFRRDTCVVFASPSDVLLNAVRKFEETYYMPSWSLDELCHAASVLNLPISKTQLTEEGDITSGQLAVKVDERTAEIRARFEMFGGVPRFCLRPQPDELVVPSHHQQQVLQWIYDLPTLRGLLCGPVAGRARLHLLRYEPDDATYQSVEAQLLSSHVVKTVPNTLLANYRAEEERQWLLCALRRIATAAPVYQSVSETATHETLRLGFKWKLRLLPLAGTVDAGLTILSRAQSANRGVHSSVDCDARAWAVPQARNEDEWLCRCAVDGPGGLSVYTRRGNREVE